MARRKQYRGPKPVRIPFEMRIKARTVFGPIEHALSELLRTGTVDVDAAGMPVFRNHNDGHGYDLAPSMAGVVRFFEMWALRHDKPAPASAMNELCGRMATDQDVSEDLVKQTLDSLPALFEIAARMDPNEAADLVQNTQIEIELKLQAA